MILGVTGGIGCGKTTILNLLKEHYNAEILEMDKVGHIVMSPGQRCYEQIVAAFGSDVLNEDKTINRNKLSAIVFDDKEKLNLLNSFVHPEVRRYADEKVNEYKNEIKTGLLVLESAILFEADYGHVCDMTWYVYAKDSVRKERLMKSRGYSEEKIEHIMKNQMAPHQLEQLTDFTIDNSNDIDSTLNQIKTIWENIKKPL